MTRIQRPLIPNATYFITSVTHKRQRWFVDPNLAQIIVDQWLHYEREYKFHLDTYCVMPDHYHVVLMVGQQKTISQILHAVDSYTATLVNGQLGHRPKIKIWQGDPWDQVIRDEGMYWQKVAYTLFNPWREGLVRNPLEPYPFSNLAALIEKEGEVFVLDLFSRHRRWIE